MKRSPEGNFMRRPTLGNRQPCEKRWGLIPRWSRLSLTLDPAPLTRSRKWGLSPFFSRLPCILALGVWLAGGLSAPFALAQTPVAEWPMDAPDGKQLSTDDSEVSTDGVALWHLDETSGPIIDSVGGNTGDYNGALYNQAGKFRGALGFDGVNEYVEITGYTGITGRNARSVGNFHQSSYAIIVDKLCPLV